MSSPQLKSLRPALFIAPGLVVEVTEIVAHKADEPNDAKFLGVDFDALGERAQVIAAVAAALGPHLLASAAGAYNTRSILSRLDSQRVRSPTVLLSNVFNEFELLSLKCFQPSK